MMARARHVVRGYLSGLLATIAALSACTDRHGPDAATDPAPMPAGLAGAYTGEFPCGNCAAIETTLWLRADARFILHQRYISETQNEDDMRSSALGRWRWDGATTELVLSASGPERRLRLAAPDRLVLATASPVEHALIRNPVAPDYPHAIRLAGIAVVTGTAATFKECLSELELDVAPDRAFGELRRQHRAFSPNGRPALTSAEGRLQRIPAEHGTREVWVLERVFSVNPNKTC